jgi:uncharacterized membrane protein YoaK (UPF0700 family)
MRPAERDVLLMLLAATAGSADAWGYFGLNHSFVANMTGNTVLIGVALAKENGDLLHPLISLLCYAVGVVAGTTLTRDIRDGDLWPKAVSYALLLEACLIATIEIAWALLLKSAEAGALERNVLLGVLAFAVGLQSAAMLRIKVPGIVTTYITGTWTNLMSGAARLLGGERQVLKTGKKQFEERLLLQGGVLVCYLLSAAAAGCLLRYAPTVTGALTAVAVAVAAVYGLLRG